MDQQDYPSVNMNTSASTEDCKALLAGIPASVHPGGKAGSWKRKSKTGSGERIERVFLCDSGLAALVAQTPGILAVEMLAPSLAELEGAMISRSGVGSKVAKSKSAAKPSTLEAQAPYALTKRVKAIMASCEEEDDDAQWIDVLQEASATPLGSPLRVAIGNQFMVTIPEDPNDDPYLDISAKGSYPSPDQPHWLEELYDKFESPNQTCVHLLSLDPSAAVDYLLENGFTHNPDQDLANVLPDWAARMEALVLEKTVKASSASSRKPGL